ncbi:MAG: diaminopimelate epimerase [Deltaproteobacteria bacterium]|nr:diaminopimelate epimerase [Deltaproteobacteria bacterium]
MSSPRAIPFTKLHGLGNDFVLVDARPEAGPRAAQAAALLSKDVVRAIADRKRGVGFDQLLVLRPSPRVHAVLDIYNADASMAEMCGNGLRAAALYLWTRGRATDHELVLETAAGDRRARALGPLDEAGDDVLIECEMGVPRLVPLPAALKRGVQLGRRRERPVCVNVGNPHAVFFTPARTDAELRRWGPLVERHKAFPRRTNVEFARSLDRHVIDVRVWERGVGVTEACGTGAVAAAVAAIHTGRADSPVEVRFPGGAAEVRWDGPKQPAFLRGHASEVFSGDWLLR